MDIRVVRSSVTSFSLSRICSSNRNAPDRSKNRRLVRVEFPSCLRVPERRKVLVGSRQERPAEERRRIQVVRCRSRRLLSDSRVLSDESRLHLAPGPTNPPASKSTFQATTTTRAGTEMHCGKTSTSSRSPNSRPHAPIRFPSRFLFLCCHFNSRTSPFVKERN